MDSSPSPKIPYSKKEHELWVAGLFAKAYNRTHKTFYRVKNHPPEADSADALLCSDKDIPPEVRLQICLASSPAYRVKQSNTGHLKEELENLLSQAGFAGNEIRLRLGYPPKNRRQITEWTQVLGEILHQRILKCRPGHTITEDGGPTQLVHFVPLFHVSVHNNGISGNKIHIEITRADPDPWQTLQEAINEKMKKRYADAKALWLVLEADPPAHTAQLIKQHRRKLLNRKSFGKVWYIDPKSFDDADIMEL